MMPHEHTLKILFERRGFTVSVCRQCNQLVFWLEGQTITEDQMLAGFERLHRKIAELETLLAECQAQAAALAQADSLTAADLRALARCAEFTAQQLNDPGDNTAGLVELAEQVRAMAARSTADDQ